MAEVIIERSVLFRTRRWSTALVVVAILTTAVALVLTACGALLGAVPAPDWGLLLVLAFPTCCGLVSTVARWHRPVWVRVCDAGIELAQGGVPIFVAWDNVASAVVRHRGLFAVLDVVPVALDQVSTSAPQGNVPPVQLLPQGAGFRVDVGELCPGPRALRRVLAEYRQHLG
ncbi:hypothetical protein EV385_6425 [Krasilnikovia cinnamomea]|uniref:Uncharacterized protein n=1 Tax=Krasilnikovia cinnamomea TaxID=349313 RepID=A0A4Q7ZU36_9ACTN|nr:hypothetical protein [Krasilnikovia cinnamomea]RZU54474.1 hypothetical protein EV385_6425 [Krasilnikovia cinnamomea]